MASRHHLSYIAPMDTPDEKADELAIIYDGECPVCAAYSDAVDVEQGAACGIRRVNARSDDALVARATAAGLDLDDGMVVVHQGKMHHGADALHLMATLAPRKGVRNHLNRLFFGSRPVARAAYPLLRAGRNALLRLRGQKKIRNLDTNESAPR